MLCRCSKVRHYCWECHIRGSEVQYLKFRLCLWTFMAFKFYKCTKICFSKICCLEIIKWISEYIFKPKMSAFGDVILKTPSVRNPKILRPRLHQAPTRAMAATVTRESDARLSVPRPWPINYQSLLRQKAAHAETHNKNKHKLQTKLTAMT